MSALPNDNNNNNNNNMNISVDATINTAQAVPVGGSVPEGTPTTPTTAKEDKPMHMIKLMGRRLNDVINDINALKVEELYAVPDNSGDIYGIALCTHPADGIKYVSSTGDTNQFLLTEGGANVWIIYDTECTSVRTKSLFPSKMDLEMGVPMPDYENLSSVIRMTDEGKWTERFHCAPCGLVNALHKKLTGGKEHDVLKQDCKYVILGSRIGEEGADSWNTGARKIIEMARVHIMDKALFPYITLDGGEFISVRAKEAMDMLIRNDKRDLGNIFGLRLIAKIASGHEFAKVKGAKNTLVKGAGHYVADHLLVNKKRFDVLTSIDNTKLYDLGYSTLKAAVNTGSGLNSGCITGQVLACVEYALYSRGLMAALQVLTDALVMTNKLQVEKLRKKVGNPELSKDTQYISLYNHLKDNFGDNAKNHFMLRPEMFDMVDGAMKKYFSMQSCSDITFSFKMAPDWTGYAKAGTVMIDFDHYPNMRPGQTLLFRAPSSADWSLISMVAVPMPQEMKDIMGGVTAGVAMFGVGGKEIVEDFMSKTGKTHEETVRLFINQNWENAAQKDLVHSINKAHTELLNKYHKILYIRLNGADVDGDGVMITFVQNILDFDKKQANSLKLAERWHHLTAALDMERPYDSFAPEQMIIDAAAFGVNHMSELIYHKEVVINAIGESASILLLANFIAGRGINEPKIANAVAIALARNGLKDLTIRELANENLTTMEPKVKAYLRTIPATSRFWDMKAHHVASIVMLQAAVDKKVVPAMLEQYRQFWKELTFGVTSVMVHYDENKNGKFKKLLVNSVQVSGMQGLLSYDLVLRHFAFGSAASKATFCDAQITEIVRDEEGKLKTEVVGMFQHEDNLRSREMFNRINTLDKYDAKSKTSFGVYKVIKLDGANLKIEDGRYILEALDMKEGDVIDMLMKDAVLLPEHGPLGFEAASGRKYEAPAHRSTMDEIKAAYDATTIHADTTDDYSPENICFGLDGLGAKLLTETVKEWKQRIDRDLLNFIDVTSKDTDFTIPLSFQKLTDVENQCVQTLTQFLISMHSSRNSKTRMNNKIINTDWHRAGIWEMFSKGTMTYSEYRNVSDKLESREETKKRAILFRNEYKRHIMEDLLGAAIKGMIAHGLDWARVIAKTVADFAATRHPAFKTLEMYEGLLRQANWVNDGSVAYIGYKSMYMPIFELFTTCANMVMSEFGSKMVCTAKNEVVAHLVAGNTYNVLPDTNKHGTPVPTRALVDGTTRVRVENYKDVDVVKMYKGATKGLTWTLESKERADTDEYRRMVFVPTVPPKTEEPTMPTRTFIVKNLFTVTPSKSADKKACAKASISTKFIGFNEGISGSSTELYRQQAGTFANVGTYTSEDVVFVSIGGKRGNINVRHEQQNRTINEAVKALSQGATLLTDNKAYVANSDYNEGEKRLAKHLETAGYTYSEITVQDQVLGVWN